MKVEDESGLILRETCGGALELAWGPASLQRESPFQINFVDAITGPRMKQARSELICRAVGRTTHTVVDLTAGLGRDSLVLACAGFHVVMVERNKVLFTLLHDALLRLEKSDPVLASRLVVYNHDSVLDFEKLLIKRGGLNEEWMNRRQRLQIIDEDGAGKEMKEDAEIAVFLDPIYKPKSVGKRANVKKETQMLHRLVDPSEGDDDDNNKALLQNALHLSTSRVVVKRSVNAEPLAGIKEQGQIKGTTQRFDLYFRNREGKANPLGNL